MHPLESFLFLSSDFRARIFPVHISSIPRQRCNKIYDTFTYTSLIIFSFATIISYFDSYNVPKSLFYDIVTNLLGVTVIGLDKC